MTRPVHASTMTVHGRLKDLADASLAEVVDVAVAAVGGRVGVLAVLHGAGTQWAAAVGDPRAEQLLPLCSFALLQSEPFALSGLPEDARFASTVVGTELVSAAGVRLVDDRGLGRGALCVFGDAPLTLDARGRGALSTLARHAVRLLGMEQAMTALRDKHRDQLALLDNLEGVLRAADHLAIVATDPSGTVRSFSVGAERLFGARAADVVGKRSFADLLPGTADLAALAARGAEARAQEWRVLRGGREVPASLVIEPVRDEEQHLTGYVALLDDLTERKIAEELKSEFVNTVTHELRTPLTSILGALSLLRVQAAAALPAKAGELLDISQRNGERLLRLVNDILDLSKLESRHTRLERTTLDLRELLGRVVESDRPFAQRSNVELVLRGALGTPVTVDVDPDRIAQVVTNLLSNATKHSAPGLAVIVELSVDQARARVSVSDQGPGIAESVRPRLFEKFVQADRSDRRVSGTGLGLSIVKAIVDLHGGTVGFDSALGRGSSFWFELPLAAPLAPPRS